MGTIGEQSSLDPAGEGAEQIAQLFYIMVGGAVFIWLVVVGLAVYALLRPARHPVQHTLLLVIGGGAVFPTVALTGLLIYGLSILPELQRPAPAGSQVISVAGARWWWRVEYLTNDGRYIALANELHLPVDEPIEFKLTSEDVIHSFWVPSLGGKMDMIPGRENRLKLVPTRVGRFRGVCAEYCGGAHADMAFDVFVVPREEFNDWLVRQGADAREPSSDSERVGQQTFLSRGCGACHSVRGTEADGVVGPDLTHFGSRHSIAAGVLANTAENLSDWIVRTHAVKPLVNMPAFHMLGDDELQPLITYLRSLQ